MGRPKGSRNEDYEQERAALSRKLLTRLIQPDGPVVSFRELARACEVSPPTLRHYFKDRDGAIRAALEQARIQGEQYLELVATPGPEPLEEVLLGLVEQTLDAWQFFGVGDIFRFGLEIGLGDDKLGPAYVDELLEPLLQSYERRLAAHMKRGELRAIDPRYASLALLSPLVLGLIHQRELGGSGCRPLDLKHTAAVHVEAFLSTWRAPE